ncbi:MAG: prepilin peptidase [Candidatus Nanohaloarchaeota archaeon QJJ-7]|nr:prepilin peptidase [Candidatus Nanohaloarchaeota archaeon QJJ-7]
MLVEVFAVFVLGGLSYAAYHDLETTEVPDSVSLVIGGGALFFHGYRSFISGSPDPLAASLASGIGLFVFGWLLYLTGMWGGADAFVLGAAGFSLPALVAAFEPVYSAPWPEQFSFLMTVFLVGSVYSVSYAVYVASRHGDFLTALEEEFETRRHHYSRIIVLFTGMMVAGTFAVYTVVSPPLKTVVSNLAAFILVLTGFLVLSLFLRTVESRAMQSKIPVDKLEEGDVLAEDIELQNVREDPIEGLTDKILDRILSPLPFEIPGFGSEGGRVAGLTSEQVQELGEMREEVKVRTGVRFVPVFPVALLLLILLGDPVYFVVLQLI